MVAAATLVAALVAVGAVVLLTRDDGPSHPSTWDPRVADLVSVVEEQKGATFEHPVHVVFLEEAEFKERLSVDDELSDEDREEIEHAEATFRALGLQGGTGSLLEQFETLRTEGVAAFYDPDRKEIVVPEAGSDHMPTKATLVHELTHALQDQLGQLEDLEDSEAAAGLEALVEGEAEFIEAAWGETLTDDELETLDEQESDQSDEASADLEDVNPAVLALFAAPYTMGQAMVEVRDQANELDDAFDDPPNSSADFLEPARWLDPIETIEVEAPELGDDEEQVGDDEVLGAHSLYLMLASALGPKDALHAAGGWGGDRMRFYRDADGTDCARVALAGVDSPATGELADAIDAWVESRPEGAATATRANGRVQFDACDVGATTDTLTPELADVPGVRAALSSAMVDAGADPEVASCVAIEIIDALPPELIAADEASGEEQQQVEDAMTDAAATCLG